MQILILIISLIALGVSCFALYGLYVSNRAIANQFNEASKTISQNLTKLHSQQAALKIGLIVVLLIIAVTTFLNHKNQSK